MRIKAAVRVLMGRQSSSSASSLAARYINTRPEQLAGLLGGDRHRIAADIRSLAASVLSQDETKGS